MTGTSTTRQQDIRLLIVEDHELARYGLSMALSDRERIQVVGEAQNGQEGVELALTEKPDVVLMDIGMSSLVIPIEGLRGLIGSF